jgi:hypothetical protein
MGGRDFLPDRLMWLPRTRSIINPGITITTTVRRILIPTARITADSTAAVTAVAGMAVAGMAVAGMAVVVATAAGMVDRAKPLRVYFFRVNEIIW